MTTSTTAALLGIITAIGLRGIQASAGRRRRVHLHHRRGRRRLPADRRLRLGRSARRSARPSSAWRASGSSFAVGHRLAATCSWRASSCWPSCVNTDIRARAAGARSDERSRDAPARGARRVEVLRQRGRAQGHLDAGRRGLRSPACWATTGPASRRFIKILSGVHQPDEGELLVDGEAVHFHSPRDARDARHRDRLSRTSRPCR